MFKIIGSKLAFACLASFFMLTLASNFMLSASAEAYVCGSQCNGHQRTWTIPNNGIVCDNSAKTIVSAQPSSGKYRKYVGHGQYQNTVDYDSDMNVIVRYSTVCQTMWLVAQNKHASTPSSCAIMLTRAAAPTWSHSYPCPAGNSTYYSPMINDHAANKAVAATVKITYGLQRTYCTAETGSSAGECKQVITGNIPFSYAKSY